MKLVVASRTWAVAVATHGIGVIAQRPHREQRKLFELSEAFALHDSINTMFKSPL